MRPIDADALKELFSEVIGRIAIKPEMNGNLEHMIRASAMVIQMIDDAPTVQPEIIRCNSCRYWTQSTGKMKGYGLGRCDFHDADLVTCNGFCYWAERRQDG